MHRPKLMKTQSKFEWLSFREKNFSLKLFDSQIVECVFNIKLVRFTSVLTTL